MVHPKTNQLNEVLMVGKKKKKKNFLTTPRDWLANQGGIKINKNLMTPQD